MVDFKLGGVQETKARMSGGIKLGVVKFILRALTAMGYQVLHLLHSVRWCVRACVRACVRDLNAEQNTGGGVPTIPNYDQARFSLQQAGMYGVPQSRRRFFIWGVLRGHTLPQFPQPTHTFPKPGSLSMLLPNVGVRLEPVTTRSAPHRYISVSEAISDLPAFEYDEPEEPKDERSRSGPHKGTFTTTHTHHRTRTTAHAHAPPHTHTHTHRRTRM
jgi:DNA (cytosine-5)-methyltransferase 1